MPRRPQFRLGYRPALDGVRALAVLAVVASHTGVRWFTGGGVGVDVFFVLSGFLITSLLIEEQAASGRIALGRFYVRRALRLFPALTLLLAGWSLVVRLVGDAAQVRESDAFTVYVAAYVANWARAFGVNFAPLGHTWSLSIEEQFYLVWPGLLVALFAWGWGRRRILALSLAGVAASLTVRLVLGRHGASVERLYNGSDTHADVLLVGCATALIAAEGWLPSSRAALLALRVVGFAGAAWMALLTVAPGTGHGVVQSGGQTLRAVLTAAFVLALVHRPIRVVDAILSARPSVWLGRLSYSLYLWHLPILFACAWALPRDLPRVASLGLALALSLAAACASYYLVEQPTLRLKRRWESPRLADGAPREPAAAGPGR